MAVFGLFLDKDTAPALGRHALSGGFARTPPLPGTTVVDRRPAFLLPDCPWLAYPYGEQDAYPSACPFGTPAASTPRSFKIGKMGSRVLLYRKC